MLVTQAEFARMKSVTPAAVSQWKREGRLVLVDKKIDVAATEERLLKESSYHSKRIKPASAADVKLSSHETELNPHNCRRLKNDDAYSGGVASGLGGMACSIPLMVAEAAISVGLAAETVEAINAALRPAILRRWEEMLNLWNVSPYVTADDDEIDVILARDTWVGRQWPEDALDDKYLIQDLTKAHLP